MPSNYLEGQIHATQSCSLLAECFTQYRSFNLHRVVGDLKHLVIVSDALLSCVEKMPDEGSEFFKTLKSHADALLVLAKNYSQPSNSYNKKVEIVRDLEIRSKELSSLVKLLTPMPRLAKPAYS